MDQLLLVFRLYVNLFSIYNYCKYYKNHQAHHHLFDIYPMDIHKQYEYGRHPHPEPYVYQEITRNDHLVSWALLSAVVGFLIIFLFDVIAFQKQKRVHSKK